MKVSYEIPKVSFEPGEEIKIAIDCDNSATRLGVKSFEVKLFRNIETSVDHTETKSTISLVDAC